MTQQDAQKNLQALIDRGLQFGGFYKNTNELMAFQTSLQLLIEQKNYK